jgi:hypothetical protein
MKNVFLLSLFISLNIIAQKRDLGKVTIQELEEKICASDTSAVAAILFSIGDVKFEYQDDKGFYYVLKVKSKIKIYKKEGYEKANKTINYYSGAGSKEKVVINEAVTYNLVNGKIEKTKMKSDGEFDVKVNEFWSSKKITLPNVREGSIIEYEYELISDHLGAIKPWYFQSDIPVVFTEFNLNLPEYYVYKPAIRGFLSPNVETNSKRRTIIYSYKENRVPGLNTGPPKTVRTDVEFRETKYTYTLNNLISLKSESYVNNINNYIASIEHELISKQFPNEPFKNYATDWETVVNNIYQNDDFGNELNKTGYFEKDLDAMLSGAKSQEEKLMVIFSFVKSKMNWNESYGYNCRNGVKKAYQDKTGNVAEINLMLTSMLRYAGFEANPILISTRSNGISLFPSRNAFDYIIAGVELSNQVVLLDATNKYSLPNVLPIRDLNWFGRLIRKDGTSLQISLMPKFNSKEIINLMAEINHQGEITGKVRGQFFDYNAYGYRDNYNGITKESMIEKIEKRHKGLEINEFDVQNNTDLSKPIIENYSFTSSNSVEIIGDKMYFSPLLHFTMTENPFKQDTRLYPIDFVYPNQEKYSVSLKIPEGYVVETLPVSKAIGLPDDAGNFKFSISNNGNQIQLMFIFDINTAVVNSDMYEEVKVFFKEMIAKQNEKIVLKKG